MVKRILSMLLAVIIVASLSIVAVNAADTTKIYFEVPDTWGNYSKVYCHIWEYGGDNLAPWQGKKERCTQVKDNLYEYDTATVGGLKDGVYYGVIFSVDIGFQTFDLVMSSECLGCTAYTTDEIYTSPQDSAKTILPAFWRGVDPELYGPVLTITSNGNIQGTCIVPDKTKVSVLTDFIDNGLESACHYRNEQPDDIINRLGSELGMNELEIAQAVYNAMIPISWDYPENFVPTEPSTEEKLPPQIIVDNTVVTLPADEEYPTFTYCAYLKTPKNIEDIQAYVEYDKNVLQLVNYETPNLTQCVSYAKDLGFIYFNAVDIATGMDFTDEDVVLIKAEFRVISGGNARIGITIEEMTEFCGETYFRDSTQLNKDVVIKECVASSTETSEPSEDATGFTDKESEPADIVETGSNNLWVVMLCLIAGAFMVTSIRKKVNN